MKTDMVPESPPTPPSQILLLTHSRTASHLLAKMLSKQPNCIYGSHFFALGPRELHRSLRKQEALGHSDQDLNMQLLSKYNDSYREFRQFLDEAQKQGKIPFIHNQPQTMIAPKLGAEEICGENIFSSEDHEFWLVGQQRELSKAHTNFTILPDELFLRPGTRPIISFRHPVLVVDGIHRGLHTHSTYADSEEGTRMHLRSGSTLRWMRMIYDWYLEKGAPVNITPIMVEADDYMGPRRESVMKELCEQAGLDAPSVIYSWPKATDEEISKLPLPMVQAFKTINSSEGILPAYSISERDLDAEMASWHKKFGQNWAELMRELVMNMMPDYEYLRARRTVGVSATATQAM